MGSHDALPDAILELVFLGLDTLICLHRAASTCKRWRRIIANDTFRALHKIPPVVTGYYYNEPPFVRPQFEPSPSAAIDGRYFSLDFLPGGDTANWRIKDSRGSLVLLVRKMESEDQMIICEPLTHRHVVVPLPPLTPPATKSWVTTATLADGDDSGDGGCGAIGMSRFMVFCLLDDNCPPAGSLRVHLFTSCGGSSWRVSSIDRLPWMPSLGNAAGRRFWHDGKKMVFALDTSTLELSSFMLPDDDDWNLCTVIENVALTVGQDGEARIVVAGRTAGNNNLKIFARVQGGGAGGEEWGLQKTVQLSAALLGLPRLERIDLSCHLYLLVETGKVTIRVPSPALAPGSWYFHLDMETMKVERLLDRDLVYEPDYKKAYPIEFPWPSSFCLLVAQLTIDNA